MANSPVPRINSASPSASFPACRPFDSLRSVDAPARLDDAWLVQIATSLAVDARIVARFFLLNERHDIAVDRTRFALDLAYAYGRLACAHGCVDEEIRQLAMTLFDACKLLELHRQRWAGQKLLH
jgi:hypothetical protein